MSMCRLYHWLNSFSSRGQLKCSSRGLPRGCGAASPLPPPAAAIAPCAPVPSSSPLSSQSLPLSLEYPSPSSPESESASAGRGRGDTRDVTSASVSRTPSAHSVLLAHAPSNAHAPSRVLRRERSSERLRMAVEAPGEPAAAERVHPQKNGRRTHAPAEHPRHQPRDRYSPRIYGGTLPEAQDQRQREARAGSGQRCKSAASSGRRKLKVWEILRPAHMV